ncbi:MAG: hypothetical protein IJB49_06895 [Clostridia bacterium]|nr:hypothetical protein [Clostridia bacterium]
MTKSIVAALFDKLEFAHFFFQNNLIPIAKNTAKQIANVITHSIGLPPLSNSYLSNRLYHKSSDVSMKSRKRDEILVSLG